MLVEPDYRHHRIEVYAQAVDGRWDAEVRIRRTVSEEKPHVERVTCRKLTAELGAAMGRRQRLLKRIADAQASPELVAAFETADRSEVGARALSAPVWDPARRDGDAAGGSGKPSTDGLTGRRHYGKHFRDVGPSG